MAEETNQQSNLSVQASLPADSPADGSVLSPSAETADADGGNEAIAPVAALADSFSPEAVSADEPQEQEEALPVAETSATAILTETTVAEGVVQQEVPEPSKVASVETIEEAAKEIPEERIIIKEVIKEAPVETVSEVIKEAPVERVVIKEVIKEVPVEKVIIKEVRVIDQEGAQRLVEEKLQQRQRDNSLLGNKKRKERREGNLSKILGKIKEGGSADGQAVRNLLRISGRTAAYYLKELVGRGLLKKERKGRRMIYKT